MSKLPLFSLLLVIVLGLTAFQPFGWQGAPTTTPGAMSTGAPGQSTQPAMSPTMAGTSTGTGPAALPGTVTPTAGTTTGMSLLASQLLRYPILNTNGDEIGQVVNFLIDANAGCIRYAVIVYSGGAGLAGERAIPLPIELLSVDQAQGGLDLNADPDTLNNAPSFARYNWPDTSAAGWEQPIRSYWQKFGAAASPGTSCTGVVPGAAAPGASITVTPAAPGATAVATPSPAATAGPSATSATSAAATPAPLATSGTATPSPAGTAGAGGTNATATPTPPAPSSSTATATASTQGGVNVTLSEYAIDMPTSLPAGSVSFVVTNRGAMPHNFLIAGQGLEQTFSRDIQPGQTQTMDVTLRPGTYDVYCPIDNHRALGMRATLTVTAEGTAATPGPGGGSLGAPTVTPAARKMAPSGKIISTSGSAPAGSAGGYAMAAAIAARGGTPSALVRVSQLPSYSIVSNSGQQLGSVTDLVVDPITWRILYAVVSPLGGLIPSATGTASGTPTPAAGIAATPTMLPASALQRLTLVPWSALTVDNTRRTLTLSTPATSLDQAPAFSTRNWPNMSQPGWDAASRNYWQGLGIRPETPAGPAPGTSGAVSTPAPATSGIVSPAPTSAPAGLTGTPTAVATTPGAGAGAVVTATLEVGTVSPAPTSVAAGLTGTPTAVATTAGAGAGAVVTATLEVGTRSPAPTSAGAEMTGTPSVAGTTAASGVGTLSTAQAPAAGGTGSPAPTSAEAAMTGTPQAIGTTAATGTIGTPVVAAGTPAIAVQQGATISPTITIMPASTIIGYAVKDPTGKDLGRIGELVGNVDTGKVLYAAVSYGGFLGINAQSVAVPWDALHLDQAQQAFILQADQATLNQAPALNGQAIDSGDPNWDANVRTYWESHGVPVGASTGGPASAAATPAAAGTPAPPVGTAGPGGQGTSVPGASPGSAGLAAPHLFRVSRLLGSAVKSSSGETLGEATDLLVAVAATTAATGGTVTPAATASMSPQATTPAAGGGSAITASSTPTSGRFLYVVVGYGGLLGIGQQSKPVPWEAFTVDPQARTVAGNFDTQTFRQAPTVNLQGAIQSPGSDWEVAIRSYWSSRITAPSGAPATPTPVR